MVATIWECIRFDIHVFTLYVQTCTHVCACACTCTGISSTLHALCENVYLYAHVPTGDLHATLLHTCLQITSLRQEGGTSRLQEHIRSGKPTQRAKSLPRDAVTGVAQLNHKRGSCWLMPRSKGFTVGPQYVPKSLFKGSEAKAPILWVLK